jgi:nucleotide-binding universal stress UspA family protein
MALKCGISLARKFSAELTLLHVIEPATPLTYTFSTESEKIEQERFERAQRMLAAMLSPEDQDDLNLRIAVTVGGIEPEIMSAIHENKADVVVMGTHGRGLPARCLAGSVTRALLRKVKELPDVTLRNLRALEWKYLRRTA